MSSGGGRCPKKNKNPTFRMWGITRTHTHTDTHTHTYTRAHGLMRRFFVSIFWLHSMMAKLIATAESDPRKPSLVTPLVVEFEGYHGHVE